MRYSIRSLFWLTALVALTSSMQRALPVIPVIYQCVVVLASLSTVIAGASGRNRILAGIFGGAVGGSIGTILFLALMPPKHWLLGIGPAIALLAFLGGMGGACVGVLNFMVTNLFCMGLQRQDKARLPPRAMVRSVVLLGAGALIAVIAVSVSWVIDVRHKVSYYDAEFSEITIGDTDESVIERLGTPHRTRMGTDQFPAAAGQTEGYVGDQNKGERQCVYIVDTPFLPIIWVYGFDDHGRLAAKFTLD